MAIIEITTMTACPLMCTFCPQDQLKAAYGKISDKYMSLETFRSILDKVPPHVHIHFSGMAEPWANPNATKMLEMALQQERNIAVYTTLYGMSVEDSVRITTELLPRFEKQVAVVCLHLPDDNMNMRGYKDSDQYRQVLKNFLNMASTGAFPAQKSQTMTMDKSGQVHDDLQDQDIVLAFRNWNGHSRAGSLGEEQVEKTGAKPTPHNKFSLICASTPYYDHNVVLPNGDVVLCCMDYSLKHIIGNLLKSDYWDLFISQELACVRIENQKPDFSEYTICKKCENVIRVDASPDEIGLGDVLRYFKRKLLHCLPVARRIKAKLAG